MPAEISARLTGLDDIQRRLRRFTEETRTKSIKNATSAGARVCRDKARQNALLIDDPLTAESISANIVTQNATKFHKRTGDHMVRVGVKGTAKKPDGPTGNPGGDTFYWRFIEFGFEHTSGVSVPARPFLLPAQLETQNEQYNAFYKSLDKAIDRLIRQGVK